jgi:hypothetical protein
LSCASSSDKNPRNTRKLLLRRMTITPQETTYHVQYTGRMSWQGMAVALWLGALLAPEQRPNSYLYPIREGNKFGFIDRTGSVVVAPK